MGDCDRTPCPQAKVDDVVRAELDPFRRAAQGVPRIEGRVSGITPYLHGLIVDDRIVGGHGNTDVITVRRR